MLSSLKNMFKVPDLRNKVLFTLLIISLYQFGANVPVPGIDFNAVRQLEQQAANPAAVEDLTAYLQARAEWIPNYRLRRRQPRLHVPSS